MTTASRIRRYGPLFVAAWILLAGGGRAQESFVRLVVPEGDTVHAQSSVYRLSAGTNPGNRISLNGAALKVYPSGGFAGLLKLAVGDNPFTLVATDAAGKAVATKSFLVIRDSAVTSSPASPLQIDSLMMQPASDIWLDDGDLLEVQVKGSPGARGFYLGKEPLTEVSPREAGGLRGVYRGFYRVQRSDTLNNRPILFTLMDSLGNVAERASRGRVSFKGGEFPRVGVTRGDRPALGFGLGEDRLGGAKMSFLVPGVRLAITGKQARQYRVALAPGREAWISDDAVELLPRGTHPPSALTGNWNVSGDERFDYVFVNLPERLPYASFQESDPSRINVEIFGASSNTNWVIQSLTTREITNVSYTQPSAGVFRITISLKHRQIWGYEISYVGGGMLVRVRRQPEKLKIKALTFAVDAGHGGATNRGALGSTGALEKDVNLATVRHLKALLEDRGARVILTRTGDEDITNGERLKKVLASQADILIAVHSNSIGLTSNPEETRGTSTYYKYPCYRPLSLCIVKEILKTGLPLNGNVGSFNFTLNSPTELPNVLVELAFMSNPEDEMKLLDDEFRRELARRIVDGVDEFLDACDE
jgi:N-acetylmuramoyl-L-alanine amidase